MPSPSRYVVPRKLADITPRDFLRLQRRIFATVTPAWRDARIAAREATPEPPPVAPAVPRALNQSITACRGRPAVRLRQILEIAATLAKPGEHLSLSRIAEASAISINTIYACTQPARMDGSWPYSGPEPRCQPKESQHAGPVPPP